MAIDFSSTVNFLSNGTTRLNVPTTGGILTSNSPSFTGEFATYTVATSNYFPTLSAYTAVNLTVDAAASKITVPLTGWYYIYCQQLITVSTGNAVYLSIFKNGVEQKCAYNSGRTTYDMNVGCILSLNANDYITFYYTGTTAYTWTGGHSSVLMYLLG